MQQDLSKPLNFVALATQTEGYSANDLKDLVGRAIHQCVIRTSKDGLKVFISAFSRITWSLTSFILQPVVLAEDFSLAQIGFTPLSLRDVKLQKSETQWSDIGGTFRSYIHFLKGTQYDYRSPWNQKDTSWNPWMANQIWSNFCQVSSAAEIWVSALLPIRPAGLPNLLFTIGFYCTVTPAVEKRYWLPLLQKSVV